MKKIQVKIDGFEGKYFIDENGIVTSYARKIPVALKTRVNKYGYRTVGLSQNGKPKIKTIHRLLAKYFIENENEYKTVNHKDGNKLNNNLDNLEWASYSMNNKHAFDMGLNKINPVYGEKSHFSRLTEDKVLKIRELTANGAVHDRVAEQFGVSQCTISYITSRRTWRHIWMILFI